MTSKYRGEVSDFVPYDEPISPEELNDEIREKFNETPELRDECLEKLKGLIKNHNMTCKTNDAFLLYFLRTRKFNVERSFQLFKNYVAIRVELHDRILNLHFNVLKTLLQENVFGALPYRDSMGRIIAFRRLGIWNTGMCTFDETIVASFTALHYAMDDPMTQIKGMVFILEFIGYPMSEILPHLRILTFWIKVVFASLPIKYAEIHLLNLPRPIRWVYEVVKPFLPEKIRHRIVFHNTEQGTLLNYISPAILPCEFGGTNGPLKNDHLMNIMENQLTTFKETQPLFVRSKGNVP